MMVNEDVVTLFEKVFDFAKRPNLGLAKVRTLSVNTRVHPAHRKGRAHAEHVAADGGPRRNMRRQNCNAIHGVPAAAFHATIAKSRALKSQLFSACEASLPSRKGLSSTGCKY